MALAAEGAAPATEPGPVRAEAVLSLEETIARARGDQPLIAAFEREAVASEEAAIAARSLPDPQLKVGVRDFPVEGENAFSPTRDNFTMYMLGVMREQVRRSTREAQASRLLAEAVATRAQGTAQQRRIQRDVMLAWLNAVEAASKQRLLAQIVNDLRVGHGVMEAAIPTGGSTPALALEGQAEISLAQAQLASARGAEARARGELARWIGPAANRPLPDNLPPIALPIEIRKGDVLIDHPQVRAAQAEALAAERQINVARAERRPNFSWSVSYGWRPSFGDLVSAEVSIPLQINRRGLQDRRVAEAQARADAARLRTQDSLRELGGEYIVALADYRSAEAQIAELLDGAIPSLEASFKAAEARYAGGQGTLELPLNIVRRYVEANVELVEQQGARARAVAELIYLTGDTPR